MLIINPALLFSDEPFKNCCKAAGDAAADAYRTHIIADLIDPTEFMEQRN